MTPVARAADRRRSASCDGSGRRAVAGRRPSPGRSRAPSRCRRRVILMLAGFRSRWTIPFSCAASSASAICRAIGQRLVERQRALRDADPPASSPSTSSSTSARDAVGFFEAVDGADVRMIQRGEQSRFALEAREPVGVRREQRGQDFDRHVPASRNPTASVCSC